MASEALLAPVNVFESIGSAVSASIGQTSSTVGLASQTSPVLTAINQETNKYLPVSLPDPQTLINMYRRGKIHQTLFFDMMLRLGFSNNITQILLNGTTNLEDVRSIITLYRRGLLATTSSSDPNARMVANEEAYFNHMFAMGYDTDVAGRLLTAQEFTPGAQDVVTFAVREVYTPDTAKAQGQYEDFPDDAMTDFMAAGVSKDQALKYWAAHWKLPGTNQFAEMYQRLHPDQLKYKQEDLDALGISADSISFDLDKMRKALRTADVMPAYRDRLTMLAFNPITRVDIRRIADTLDLPLDQLIFLNREIGMSPANARQMAIWIKMTNIMKDIIPALKNNEMTFDEAINALVEAGATEDQAKAQIDRRKSGIMRARLGKQRDVTISLVKEAYELTIDTRDEAKSKLVNLHLDDTEAEYYLTVWDAEIDLKNKKKKMTEKNLTAADIAYQYENGMIQRAKAKDMLISIGYDEVEAEFKLQILDDKIAAAAKKEADKKKKALTPTEKELSKSDIKKQYDIGDLDDTTAYDALVAIRYTTDAAASLVATWKKEKEGTITTPGSTTEKDLAKADIEKLFKLDEITEQEAFRRLKGINYTDDAANALVITWKIEKEAKSK